MKLMQLPDWRLVFTLLGSSLLVVGAMAAEPARTATVKGAPLDGLAVPGLIQYQTPAGEDYAALILPAPPAPAVKSGPHDHILIVDTSASQSGPFRTRSLSIASAIAAALPEGDRLLLLASDVTADDLTFGFAGAKSPELAAGLQRLEERVPLGSSNLELALNTSLKNFNQKSFKGNRGKSVLYLGDGFSTAQLIQSLTMLRLVGELRDAGIPVSSFGVGPRIDLVVLGTLAQHTGGVVSIDEPNVVAGRGNSGSDAVKIGRELVRAAQLPVFYPEQITTKPEISGLQPTALPPVRFDRETVLLGQGLRGSQVSVKMTGMLTGQPKDFTWKLESEKLGGSAGFVFQAWKMARETNGVAMPLAGRALVLKSHNTFQSQIESLADSGVTLLGRKNLTQAEQVAQSLQQLDPSSVEARQILATANKLRTQPVKHQRVRTVAQADAAQEQPVAEEKSAVDSKPEAGEAPAKEGEPATEPAPSETNVDSDDKSDPKKSSLLEELSARQQVKIQELTAEVNLVVDEATRLATMDFGEASDLLKDLMSKVDSSLELPEGIRQSLRRKLDKSLQKLENEDEIHQQRAAALRLVESRITARKKLMDQADRDEERMQQLIERVRALLVRGVRGEATAFEEAEEYSRIAVELDPYNYVPNLDVFNSEAFGALDKARRMRNLRADKFLATMHEVELAHVPFPDEPPILWPSAERWRDITIKREKWKSVDLKSYSKQEEKIVSALNKPMKEKFDFVDATLDDVRTKIMEVYEINVIIDKLKLEEETIATDTADINLVISDILLKNALKLVLEPKNLTYIVQDEVLKITTKTDTKGKMPIKAIYAGDLATPINPLFGTGGSQAGGQQGGGGQFGGGQQGGQFGGGAGGFGGGGFGGGGFGGGGGGNFFNVPPPQSKPLQGPAGNGFQAKPEVQPKPVLPKPAKAPAAAGDEVGAIGQFRGQSFAQVQDKGAESGALNGESLKARKKKQITER